MYVLESMPNAIIDWNMIFLALSVSQFDQVYQELDFPFQPSPDLQQLARDFSVTFYTRIGQEIPEKATVELHNDLEFEEWAVGHFENAFARLERMGYAEAVYTWATYSYRWFKLRKDKGPIKSAWTYLLSHWALIECTKEAREQQQSYLAYGVDWYDRIKDWRPDAVVPFQPLPLTAETIARLQAIVLDYTAHEILFRQKVDQIKTSVTNEWERFALRRGGLGSWISLEGSFRIEVKEWEAIFNLLSADEVQVLEPWGVVHKHRSPQYERDLVFPLVPYKA